MSHADILAATGLTGSALAGGTLVVRTPVDGTELARLKVHDAADIGAMVASSQAAFAALARRPGPAPRRAGAPARRGAARGTRTRSAAWSRSRPARSCRRAWAKCRR